MNIVGDTYNESDAMQQVQVNTNWDYHQIPVGTSCTYYTLEDDQAILNRIGLDTRAGEVVYVRQHRPEFFMFAPVKPVEKAKLEVYRQWLRDYSTLRE